MTAKEISYSCKAVNTKDHIFYDVPIVGMMQFLISSVLQKFETLNSSEKQN